MQNCNKLGYSYSTIESILRCPLCHNRFTDPRALPCQHVFCASCLRRIASSNKLCLMITCPSCNLIYPYQNNPNQFPQSYIHKQLMDLIPMNVGVKGKCSKCKRIHSLEFCSCCGFHLCRMCTKNDRENILINLQALFSNCTNILSGDLLHRTQSILSNPSSFELQDILSTYHLVVQRSNECGHDQSSTVEDNNDDEIIYVETIQSNSTSCTLAK